MKRQCIVILVEGRSDYTIVDKIINAYKKILPKIGTPKIKVYYKPKEGDCLTKRDEKTQKYRLEQECLDLIAERIDFFLDSWLSNDDSVRLEDITAVWVLTDMDGVCISDSSIRINPDPKAVFNLTYTETEILAKPDEEKNRDVVADAIDRNSRKRRNINYILQGHNIRLKFDDDTVTVPLSIYYMSTNLEHVTVNIRQAEQDDKGKLAEQWCNEIASNGPEAIKEFFSKLLHCKPTYERSWQYIMEYGTNRTLSRSSNFRLVLDSIESLSRFTEKRKGDNYYGQ